MNRRLQAATLVCIGSLFTHPAKAANFTLSESAIWSLDYNLSNSFVPPPSATIIAKQDIPGTGVQYTVHFPSTNAFDSFFFQVSDSLHGAGTLAGLNVGSYSNFVLQFKIVSIDGSTSSTRTLEVGAAIAPFEGGGLAYRPEITSLTGSFPSSAISTIAVTSAILTGIGFTLNEWPPGTWSAGPHDVTLLVQPVPGATNLFPPQFNVTAIGREGNDVRITWQTTGGLTNMVQAAIGGAYTTNFVDLPPSLIISGVGPIATNYLDIGGATNTPARYYRVRRVP